MNKFIPIILCLWIVLFSTDAKAEWSLKDINETIDHTNWVVNDSCSGTTLDASRRLILTNFHCVVSPGAPKPQQNHLKGEMVVSRITYTDFTIAKEIRYSAIVKVASPALDIAVLEIRDTTAYLYGQIKFPPNDYKMVRGEKVFIVGNPQMLDASLVLGNISSVARTMSTGPAAPFNQYFQVSGGMAGGVSGGAVYNDKGEFIGIPTLVSPNASYLGMAIPVSVIKSFLTGTGVFPKFD